MTKRRSLWQEQPRASGATTFRVRRRGVDIAETFEAKADGRRWAAETIAAIDRGSFVDPRDGEVTLAEWSTRWLDSKRGKSGKYQADAAGLLTNWVLPRFGETSLRDIDQQAVIAWVGDMATGTMRNGSRAPLSSSKITQARLALSGCLELAVSEQVIARNTANTKQVRMALPKVPRKTVKPEDVPTEWEVASMVNALPGRWSVLAETIAYGALRLGEGLALRPANVTARGVTLTHAVGKNPNGPGLVLKTLKGYAERKVPLGADLVDRLGEQVALRRLGAEDLLFPGEEGGLLHAANWHKAVWLPTRTALDLPPFSTRHLRNFGARLFLEAGATIEDLRKLLGHQDIATTARYLTTDDDRLGTLADRIETQRREALRLRPVSGDSN